MDQPIDGVRLKSQHRKLLLILSVFISVCTISHQILLFVMHYQVVYELDPEPHMSKVVPHAVPTYLPVVTFPCCICVTLCFMTAFRTTDGLPGLLVGIHTFISILLTLTYPVQIIIYLYAHTHLYLAAHTVGHPGYSPGPRCVCSTLLNTPSVTKASYRCLCSSEDGAQKAFYFESGPGDNVTWYDMVTDVDPDVTGSLMFYTNTSNMSAELDYTPSYQGVSLMLVGLQASILIMVVRMPLFMLWNDVEFTQESEEAKENLRKIMRGKRTSVVGVGGMTSEHTEEQDDTGQTKETEPRRKLQMRFLINLALYGFMEGTDAFSLVELFQRETQFYISHLAVTNIILMIISINIIVINFSNLIVVIPKKSRNHRRLWRLMVALAGNLPLLIIRCCILSFHGGLDFVCFGCVYVLFMVKELTLVILGFGEYVMDECIGRLMKKRLALEERDTQPEEQYGNGFLGNSLNLASSISSNRADKYRVDIDQYKKEQKRRKSRSGKETSVRPVSYGPDEQYQNNKLDDAVTESTDHKDYSTEPRDHTDYASEPRDHKDYATEPRDHKDYATEPTDHTDYATTPTDHTDYTTEPTDHTDQT